MVSRPTHSWESAHGAVSNFAMHLPLSTILVTTDLSPLGDAALPIAFRMAHDHGAKLIVLSVVETPPAPSPLYAHYYPRPARSEIEKQSAELHAELKKRISPELSKGVTWETLIGDGDAATEIARVARERNASVIILSTHGRTGLRHFFLGSVAERVLKNTQVPVFLVR